MIYLSEDGNPELIEYLSKKDSITFVRKTFRVYEEISSHPDIYYCQLGDKVFKGNLRNIGFTYPENIIYNGACTGKYFIHNLKYTDRKLLETAKSMGMILIDVKQGYSKCNTLIVDENSVIISDKGMFSPLKKARLNVLLIEEGHILLKGFSHGFIGGCSGKINNEIVFNGNLNKHPNYEEIINFINERNIKIKHFEDYPLTDIGSILEEIYKR